MTSLKFKKMSVLLGVSAIALCTLSADPTISGNSYVQATSAFTGTSSSDVDVTPYSKTTVNVENEGENTYFYMQNFFTFDNTTDVAYSVDDVYLQYTADADEFGNSYGMQFGKSYMSWTGAYDYTAGDIVQDGIEDWSETWNLQVNAPVVSNEDGALILTPFAVFDMGDSNYGGLGAIANYAFTEDGAVSEVEGTYYYDAVNEESKVGFGLVGNLGLDFGLAGNLNVSDTTDFEASTYMTKTMDSVTGLFEVLYVNDDYVSFRPQVAYAVNDAVTVTAYTEASMDLDTQDFSYDAEVYATCYLADDLYVRPYVISDLSDSVSLRLRVYKSF
jgi:hypothetical protein